MDQIIEQLKELKNIKPNKDWANSQRELLLSQITKQNVVVPQPFLVNGWFLMKSLLPGGLLRFAARPIGVFSIILVLVFGSGMLGVNASRASLPGDFLYPVKRTSERMKIGFTVKEEKKAVLHVQLAEERVKEIEAVVQKEQAPEKKTAKIKIAIDELQQEMKSAQSTLEKVKDAPQQKRAKAIVEAAKTVDQKVEAIGAKIEQKKTEAGDIELVKTLEAAIRMANETSVKAMELIVEKHQDGDVELSQEEIKETMQKIDKKIDQAQEQVQAVVAEVKEMAKTVNEAAANVIGSEGTINQTGAESVTATANEAGDKLQALQSKPIEAEQKLSEAKTLLNNGDLSSAIQKIRQSTDIAQEVQQSVEVIKTEISDNK